MTKQQELYDQSGRYSSLIEGESMQKRGALVSLTIVVLIIIAALFHHVTTDNEEQGLVNFHNEEILIQDFDMKSTDSESWMSGTVITYESDGKIEGDVLLRYYVDPADSQGLTFATFSDFRITDAYTGIGDDMDSDCYSYSIIMREDYLGYRLYIELDDHNTGGHGQVALHIEPTHFLNREDGQTMFRIGVGEGHDIPITIPKLS